MGERKSANDDDVDMRIAIHDRSSPLRGLRLWSHPLLENCNYGRSPLLEDCNYDRDLFIN